MKGNLYLIPNNLGDNPESHHLPFSKAIFENITTLIVENGKVARKFLKSINIDKALNEFEYLELNKHDKLVDYSPFIAPALNGEDVGVISDAGCPGIADPGSDIVALAHRNNIRVIPLIGASSILLSLMASGFNGQSFVFHGYLPIDRKEKANTLKKLERNSSQLNQTQIFIETPYRNHQMMEDILLNCDGNTQLCVACNLTLKDEFIKTFTVNQWKGKSYQLHKKPTVFLLSRAAKF